MKRRAVHLVPVLVLGAVALAGCTAAAEPAPTAAAGTGSSAGPGITARGTGTVRGTPDTMTVVLGVQTRGDTAEAALGANNERATALIEALKGRGVPAEDLQTSQLSIYPSFDQQGTRITGYEVSNQVTATLRDIPAAGATVDAAAVAAGDAIRVQQLGFSIDDDSEPRAQARADAVRQAQDQARQLAEAAGVALGPIRTITEVVADPPGLYPGAVADQSASRSLAPVEPGTQELSVVVEVVYGIDQ
jgi:uncharacterized protein YggE